MNDSPTPANPYEAPAEVAAVSASGHVVHLAPGGNTIMPRYLAASADIVGAFVLSVVVVKLLPEDAQLLQCVVAIVCWIGYYFLPEWLFSTTPGKWLAGLTVTTLDGDRTSWWQVAVRTLFRILEVNPFIIGGLPAAISILVTQRRQRLGDIVAGTVVVRRKRSH